MTRADRRVRLLLVAGSRSAWQDSHLNVEVQAEKGRP